MAFLYDPPPGRNRELRQGELLKGVWEHRVDYPAIEIADEQKDEIEVEPTYREYVVILTADCDLLQDFRVRDSPFTLHGSHDDNSASLPYVLGCDPYPLEHIRPRFTGLREIWRRIEQNQDERYHRLEASEVRQPDYWEADIPGWEPNQTADKLVLPDFYIDFKKTLAFPTWALYEGIRRGMIGRVAVIPQTYVQDIMHRFYGYLSRVGLPD